MNSKKQARMTLERVIGIEMIVMPGPAYSITQKKKEPDNTNSVFIWRVDPTRNEPRLRKHYGKTMENAAGP